MAPIVEISNVTYYYRGREDRPALRGLSLTIERGEFLAVAGRTGSGKSTLCYALNGLVPHSFGGRLEGEVRVAGLDTRQATVPELARHAGIVLQSAESQIVGLTVAEDVEFGLENLALPVAEIRARAGEALAAVRLTGFADRSPWTLSGGQKQRAAIAAALAFRPELLVLDNPTAELDPLGKQEVLETVARLNREAGLTVVIADQELAEVIPYASRLALMENGQITALGTLADVLDQAETVLAAGVKLPDVTELAYRLRQRGQWTGRLPVTVDEAAAGLRAQGTKFTLAPRVQAVQVPNTQHAIRNRQSPLLRVEQLTHRYPGGHDALSAVTLDIHRGEFVALMGPNGAGKTTLARHFNGLLKPTEGRVLVDSVDTRERTVAQLAARVGYVFQNPDHQIFAPTVAEELAFGPKNLGWPPQRIAEAVEKMLADLGLAGQAQAEPFFMGLAERKLIALGSVLIMGPEVLILDEPATGADHGVAQRLMGYIADLHRRSLTVIIITHDVSLAANYADRLLVLRDGRLVLDGPPRTLLADREALAASHLVPPQVTQLGNAIGVGGVVRVGELVEAVRIRD